jgi:hypothetical protein
MSMQAQRRDPQPMSRGGELALVISAGASLLLALAALLGLGLASALWGTGWVWPHGSDSIGAVLGGIMSGHPGEGLPGPLQAHVPGPAVVYSAVAGTELLMLTVTGTAGVLFWRYHRPADARRGMATRAEAEQVLGISRLRSSKAIIRPDLHRPNGTPDRAG